jgi:hypothetical protein
MDCAPVPVRPHRRVHHLGHVLRRRRFLVAAIGCGGAAAAGGAASKLAASGFPTSPRLTASPALPGSQWAGTSWAGGWAPSGPAQPWAASFPQSGLPAAVAPFMLSPDVNGPERPVDTPEPGTFALLGGAVAAVLLGRAW